MWGAYAIQVALSPVSTITTKKLRYQIHIWCKCLSCSWIVPPWYWWLNPIVQEIAHFLTVEAKGLKMVSESKFCAEFENPFLSCRTGGFKAPERVNYPAPHIFPNVPKIIFIPIMSLLMHQMT